MLKQTFILNLSLIPSYNSFVSAFPPHIWSMYSSLFPVVKSYPKELKLDFEPKYHKRLKNLTLNILSWTIPQPYKNSLLGNFLQR